MRLAIALLTLVFGGCASAPPSPRQAQLDACLKPYGNSRPFSAYLYGDTVRVTWMQSPAEGAGVKERRQQAIDALFACMGVQRKN